MSYPGRQWLVAYAEQEARIELAYWRRHSDCLTTAERQRIKDGDYSPLRRPVKPTMQPGQWLRVSEKIMVRVEGLSFKGRIHRVLLDSVRDTRSGGRAVDRRLHEDPDNITTLCLTNPHADPPEPEKIPNGVVKDLPYAQQARARFDAQKAKETTRRLQRSLVEEVREAKLTEDEVAYLRRALADVRSQRQEAA